MWLIDLDHQMFGERAEVVARLLQAPPPVAAAVHSYNLDALPVRAFRSLGIDVYRRLDDAILLWPALNNVLVGCI